MSKAISKKAFKNTGSSLAFQLNEEASRRLKNGDKVLNVCIGSFFDDDNNLISFNKLDEIVKNNVGDNSKKYASIDGGEPFKTNVSKQVFRNYYDELNKKFFIRSCATPGGTGALFLAFKNYIDENPILLPNIGWGNYKSLCANLGKTYETYSVFEGENFDVDGLLEKAKRSLETYSYCSVLINDPCENPTGYCLTDNEIQRIIDGLNKLSKKGTVNLILDIAYIEYSEEPLRFFKHLNNTKCDFFTLVCFSASKLFGIYGYRLGALVCLANDEENAKDFENSSDATSRACWSNINHLAINAFNDYFKDERLRKELIEYSKKGRIILQKRYLEARKMFDPLIGNKPLPYMDGFFIVYEKENANEFCKQLVKEKNIYALPLESKYIRVSICSFVNK